jgi:type IV pilus assembly protein PilM
MVDWSKEFKLSSLAGRGSEQPKPDEPAVEAVAAESDAPAAAPKPAQTSIWKKEVSLGRKPKAEQPAPQPVAATVESPREQKTSFWKKEISFGGKSKQQTEPVVEQVVDVAPVVEAEPDTPEKAGQVEKTSFWKKELSFGGKSKQQAEPVAELEVVAPVVEAEPDTPEKAGQVEKTSFWKKEISFGRKSSAEAPAAVVPAEEPAEEVVEPEPVAVTELPTRLHGEPISWAKSEQADPVAPEAPAEPAPVIPLPIPTLPEPAPGEPAAELSEHEPEEPAPAASEVIVWPTGMFEDPPSWVEPEAPSAPVAQPVWPTGVFEDPAPKAEPEAPAAPAAPPVWPAGVFEDSASKVEPEAPAAPPVWPTGVFEDSPSGAEPVAPAAPPVWPTEVFEDSASSVQETRSTPSAPVGWGPEEVDEVVAAVEPAPIEHEPVAVEVVLPVEPELPVAPAPPEKKSFLKKEISFGRKRKAKVAAAAVVAAEATAEPVVAKPEKKSFLKKELSFRRKPKAKAAAAAAVVVAAEPAVKPAKKSFLKKEISFGRKRKAKVAAAALVAAEATAEPAEPAAAKPEKKPFLKKELSFGRKSKQPAAKPVNGSVQASTRKVSKEMRNLVGLKIGASQLAAARVENNGAPHLVQVAREPLAPGLVVSGEVKEPEELAAALKSFFDKHKLPRRGVRLGIANNRIGVRSFEISGIDDPKQLANAIRFRAQEVLPIPLDEAVLDYQVLEESVDEEGAVVRRILLVVAYRELVDRYVAACRQAGIKLAGIDLEAFALLRALAEPGAGIGVQQDAALVVVAIGHDRSTFAVSDGQVCEFTRVLDWGGASLNNAIAQGLEVSETEAEAIKRAISLGGPVPTAEGITETQMAKAVEAVRAQFQAFARDLVASLRFYQSQPGSLGIGEIIVTGGTAQLPGLGAELERLLGVHVRVGDPLVRVKVGKKVDEAEDMSSLTAAIGLGIED